VNAPPAVMDQDLSLTALLDLCSVDEGGEEHGTTAAADLRAAGTALREWTRDWTRRATEWGAGPQGSWRAW
jgi:hypothetical protein